MDIQKLLQSVCDLKIGSCIQPIEYMKVCEFKFKVIFLDHGPRSFTNLNLNKFAFLRNHWVILTKFGM